MFHATCRSPPAKFRSSSFLRTLFITGIVTDKDDVVYGYVILRVSQSNVDIRQMVCDPPSTGLGTVVLKLVMSIWFEHRWCVEAEINLSTFLFYKKFSFNCATTNNQCGSSCTIKTINAIHMTLNTIEGMILS